jgi:hypothetical protein
MISVSSFKTAEDWLILRSLKSKMCLSLSQCGFNKVFSVSSVPLWLTSNCYA